MISTLDWSKKMEEWQAGADHTTDLLNGFITSQM